jgi:hypothetical protein
MVLGLLVAAVAAFVPWSAGQQAEAAPPRFTAAIDALSYSGFGTTVRPGARLVTMRGLAAAGLANCNGQAACLATGIHGQSIDVDQDLRIVIDVIGAGVVSISGQTRGTVATTLNSGPVSRSFSGAVGGTAICNAGICDITLSVVGRAPRRGLVELELSGQLDLSGARPVWLNLGGTGIVSMEDVDQI